MKGSRALRFLTATFCLAGVSLAAAAAASVKQSDAVWHGMQEETARVRAQIRSLQTVPYQRELRDRRFDRLDWVRRLELARRHVSLGDGSRALDLLPALSLSVKTNGVLDLAEQHQRIRVEALRLDGRHAEAVDVCLSLVSGSQLQRNLWLIPCSRSIHALTLHKSRTDKPTAEQVSTFATGALRASQDTNRVAAAVLVASALRNLGDEDLGVDILHSVLRSASVSDYELGRARGFLALAMHWLSSGRGDQAVSVLRRLVDTSAVSAWISEPLMVDEATRVWSHWVLARIYLARGNHDQATKDLLAAKDLAQVGYERFLSLPSQAFLRLDEARVVCAQGNAAECLLALGNSARDPRALSLLVSTKPDADSDGVFNGALTAVRGGIAADRSNAARLLRALEQKTVHPLEALAAIEPLLSRYAYPSSGLRPDGVSRKEALAGRLHQLAKRLVEVRKEAVRAENDSVNATLGFAEVSGRESFPRETMIVSGLSQQMRRLHELTLQTDAATVLLWEQQGGPEMQAALLVRDALLRRLKALNDPVWEWQSGVTSYTTQGKERVGSIQAGLHDFEAEIRRVSAQRNALQFLASRDSQKSNRISLETFAAEIASVEAWRKGARSRWAVTMIESNPVAKALKGFNDGAAKAHDTVKDLWAGHERQLKKVQEVRVIDDVRSTWLDLQHGWEDLFSAMASAEREFTKWKEALRSDLEGIRLQSQSLELSAQTLAKVMSPEIRSAITGLMKDLLVRIDVADSRTRLLQANRTLSRAQDAQEEKNVLEAARRERERWLQAWEQSLGWGLAR